MAISHDTRVRVAFHCGRARELLRNLSILEPAHAELFTNTLVELDRIAELVGGITPAIQRILDAPRLDPGLTPHAVRAARPIAFVFCVAVFASLMYHGDSGARTRIETHVEREIAADELPGPFLMPSIDDTLIRAAPATEPSGCDWTLRDRL